MNRKLHPLLIFPFCFLLFLSCRKNNPDTGAGNNTSLTLLNVPYGTDPQQQMDIYLPAGRDSTTRIMILIHGGGWNSGDKTDFNAYVDSLKRREPSYAIFNLNYRLATGTAYFFPTQENDVKAAVDFILAKSADYQVSKKLVLVGASAGAHLALLQAYKYNTNSPVRAVVDFFGPTELADMYANPPNPLVPLLLASVTGGSPASNPDIYFSSSPVHFISATSCPTLIFHGGADIVVSPTQSVMLSDQLQAAAVPHEYFFYPSEGHGWEGSNLSDSFDKIAAFLSLHVH
ncbi:MAG: alpha/beta hydrolase fold domain-containing protein [Terrimonas sp.]|nr:alpha/beta hydrolase fold domain-containing protein [Terrimonas sp.]